MLYPCRTCDGECTCHIVAPCSFCVSHLECDFCGSMYCTSHLNETTNFVGDTVHICEECLEELNR